LAYEAADRVIAVSYQLRDFHSGHTGFPARKIAVIHNGVDPQRFFPDPAGRIAIREELGISDGEFCIGCVGNLLPVKDHLTLLKAAAELDRHSRNWRLLLVGDGPELPNLEAFVNARPGWKRKVHFAGRSRRVPELLRAMDVFILPSVSEGICNALLEAMAAALPVAVTAAGGNPEVVADGKSGLVFPVGDCGQLASLLRMLQTKADVCAELGKSAMRRVRESFSIDSMVRKYQEMYEDLRPAAHPPAPTAWGA
jgi:glycosyltransferase involved in cell wall biosynthesis